MKIKELLPTQYSGPEIFEAGVDEAGRGCLAGPVFVSAVILPPGFQHICLQDSKRLTEKQRLEAVKIIKEYAIDWSVVPIDWNIIDEINILEATMLGMNRAINSLKVKIPDFVVIDGNRFKWIDSELDITLPDYKCVVHGDATYANIASASILAKTARDEWMKKASEIYPEYGFDKNAGYGTVEHKEAIKKYGLSPIHRKTFKLKQK